MWKIWILHMLLILAQTPLTFPVAKKMPNPSLQPEEVQRGVLVPLIVQEQRDFALAPLLLLADLKFPDILHSPTRVPVPAHVPAHVPVLAHQPSQHLLILPERLSVEGINILPLLTFPLRGALHTQVLPLLILSYQIYLPLKRS